jgi:glycerol-3-phosphate dehydrogenase (NAD(P)+)
MAEETSESKAKKIVVIGSGSFGTSLATVAARNNHNVFIYARNSAQAESININHKNSKYLSEFDLLPNITATCNITEALADADLIILALPTQGKYKLYFLFLCTLIS